MNIYVLQQYYVILWEAINIRCSLKIKKVATVERTEGKTNAVFFSFVISIMWVCLKSTIKTVRRLSDWGSIFKKLG